MIGIPIALLWANASEWITHKYLLHGVGLKKGAPFNYHFYEHHRAVRQHDGGDPGYDRSVLGWHAQGKEVLGLVVAAAFYAPLFPIAPFFTAQGAISAGFASFSAVASRRSASSSVLSLRM